MAYTFAAGQYLSANDPVDTAPLTMAGWFNLTTINITQNLLVITQAINNSANSFGFFVNSSNVLRGLISQTNNYTEWASTGTITQNTWFHACVVFNSSTSRTIYRDGGNSATNTVLSTPVAGNLTVLTTGWGSNTIRGLAADCAVWNTALTAEEVSSLAKGFSASLIQPGNLVYYAPMIRDLTDISGAATITNTGPATVTEHPRIYGI